MKKEGPGEADSLKKCQFTNYENHLTALKKRGGEGQLHVNSFLFICTRNMFAARKSGGGFFLGFTSESSIRIFFQTESYRPAASSINILDEVMGWQ